jgi:hypothetical protein
LLKTPGVFSTPFLAEQTEARQDFLSFLEFLRAAPIALEYFRA